jgi:hypothetical protein
MSVAHLVYATSHLSFVGFYSCLVSWLAIKIPNMNKMRQMTSCVHKMCKRMYGQTNMKRAITLAKINHPWNRYNMRMYLGWLWSEHAHIIPISRMVDFCERYSPFHVCLTIRPFAHLVYATSHWSSSLYSLVLADKDKLYKADWNLITYLNF